MDHSERVAVYSIITNLCLVLIKYGLAILSGSIALVADAIHSTSDIVSSATVLFGIRISRRRSRAFPYGLYKVENLVSLVTVVFILLAGYGIVRTVFSGGRTLHLGRLPFAVVGVLATIGITWGFSRYEIKKGEETGSPSLVADGQHMRTDMLSSVIILAGLVGSSFKLPLDKGAALIVVLFIGRAATTIFLDAIRVLLDASLDFRTMDRVKALILSEPQVAEIEEIMGRNSGRYKFIEVSLTMKVRDLEKAHFISQKIEGKIRREVPHVDRFIIHYEPQRKETITYAVPLGADKNRLSEHFGEAPYFYLLSLRAKDGTPLEERVLKNPYLDEERGKGIKVSELLVKEGVDIVFRRGEFAGKGPAYVFSDAGVEMRPTEAGNLAEWREQLAAEGWGIESSVVHNA